MMSWIRICPRENQYSSRNHDLRNFTLIVFLWLDVVGVLIHEVSSKPAVKTWNMEWREH